MVRSSATPITCQVGLQAPLYFGPLPPPEVVLAAPMVFLAGEGLAVFMGLQNSTRSTGGYNSEIPGCGVLQEVLPGVALTSQPGISCLAGDSVGYWSRLVGARPCREVTEGNPNIDWSRAHSTLGLTNYR